VAVRAEHAVKVYGTADTAVTALDDVSIAFPAGRFTAIMGPSGSGKSTLLHGLAGLDTLTAGKAFVGEVELGALSDRQLTLLRRDRIGFVFQAFNLVPTLSARDNITLPMTLAGTAPDPDWLATVIERTGLTLGGVILGTFLGWAVVRSSSGASLAVFAAPPLQLILFLVLGAVTGILAGIRPPGRAARLNMISAITAA